MPDSCSKSSQYCVSEPSFSEIVNLATKSAFVWANCASLILAPILVPLLRIWRESTQSFSLATSPRANATIPSAKSKLSSCSCFPVLFTPPPNFTISPFHYSTISPFHHFTISPFHHFTISPFHHFTISLFHHFTISLFHYFTISLFHHFTTSLFHYFTISPFHYFTISLFHHFTISLFHYFTL